MRRFDVDESIPVEISVDPELDVIEEDSTGGLTVRPSQCNSVEELVYVDGITVKSSKS